MPSRFVTEASRHVTPSHADASRSERDSSVTSGGQVADKTRTDGGVPRDIHGTDAAVTGGKRLANALVTRDAPVTEEERQAKQERRSAISSEEWRHRQLMQGLGELRILGRHSTAQIGMELLNQYFKEHGVPADKGRGAFRAGQQDRARGVRCMCPNCAGQINAEAPLNQTKGFR